MLAGVTNGAVRDMSTERLIIVIHPCEAQGRNLKELIEFMDAPRVEVATPRAWRDQLGAGRLAAVFISDDVQADERDQLITDIGEMDPNTPIVMVAAEPAGGPANA